MSGIGKSSLRWMAHNFPGVVAFAVVMWALIVSNYEMARYFLLLAVLFGISRQVADLRERMDRER